MLVFISYNTRDREKAPAVEAALAARHPEFEGYLDARNVAGVHIGSPAWRIRSPVPMWFCFLPRGRSGTGKNSNITKPHASALAQTDRTGQRSSFASIASADLVQTKGLGLALCSAR